MVSIPKSRILVIRDDPAMRDLVAAHLSRRGYADDEIAIVVVPIAPASPIDALLASIERSHVPLLCTLADLERAHVQRVLATVSGNKARAARILGIERKTLYRMLERWSPSTDSPRHPAVEAGALTRKARNTR